MDKLNEEEQNNYNTVNFFNDEINEVRYEYKEKNIENKKSVVNEDPNKERNNNLFEDEKNKFNMNTTPIHINNSFCESKFSKQSSTNLKKINNSDLRPQKIDSMNKKNN